MILKIFEDSGPEIMNDLTGIEAAAVSRSLTSVESWFWKKTILKGFTTQRALNFKIVKLYKRSTNSKIFKFYLSIYSICITSRVYTV